MTAGIYFIHCLANGTFYVGASKNLEQRWKHHVYELSRNKHGNQWMQRTWNKYGSESFISEDVEIVSNPHHLSAVEQSYLDWAFSALPKKVMNICTTSRGGPSQKGIPKPAGFGEKIRSLLSGVKHTPTRVNNMRRALTKLPPVEAIDPATGSVVHVFTSLGDARRAGHHSGTISKCIRGVTRYKTHHGFIWRRRPS